MDLSEVLAELTRSDKHTEKKEYHVCVGKHIFVYQTSFPHIIIKIVIISNLTTSQAQNADQVPKCCTNMPANRNPKQKLATRKESH